MLVTAVAAGILLLPAPAQAATITVTTNADEWATGGGCSLREAIQAADNNAAFGGCPAGAAGHDDIVVPAGSYDLDALTDTVDEAAGDLDVRSDVAISGAGATQTIVDGIDLDRVMEIENATVTLAGMTLRDGAAGLEGGGLAAGQSTVTLSGLVITSNVANSPMSGGGGIFASDSELTVVRTTISDNSGASGAGIWTNGPSLTVVESTLSGNIGEGGDGNGGGIFNNGGDLTVTNTTVSGNSVPSDGGGIHSDGGDVAIENATITGNTADDESDDDDDGDGGGIRNNGGTMTVANSIIADNRDRTASVGEPEECSGEVTSLGYNIIGHDEGCAYTPGPGDQVGVFFPSLNGIDPKLGPLSDNGGPTETHMPLSESPALDQGSPERSEAAAACEATDQRGVPRPQGSGCDVGAYELGHCLGVLINRVGFEGAGTVTGTDGADGILGHAGGDDIEGLGGDDAICAGGGDDTASGGGGDDAVLGEDGKDQLGGDEGNDSVKGGPGNDRASGGAGNDQVLGQAGNDRLGGQGGKDVLKGQQGKDKLNGGGGKDRLVGGPKKDTCSGGPGKDKAAGCSTERKIP